MKNDYEPDAPATMKNDPDNPNTTPVAEGPFGPAYDHAVRIDDEINTYATHLIRLIEDSMEQTSDDNEREAMAAVWRHLRVLTAW